MKIAVPYENGLIFQHFGHTETMKLYTVEGDEVVTSEVIGTNGTGHGALASFLAEKGVKTVICGGIGAGAIRALENAAIKVYAGCQGEADRAVENLLNHTLMYNPNPTCDHHEHKEGHECGGSCGSCGNACGEHEDQMITLTVTDEDGNEEDAEFRVIGIYEEKGTRYIALTPDLDAPELEADIFLFRYLEENGQASVEEILADEEFAAAADAFQRWQLSR